MMDRDKQTIKNDSSDEFGTSGPVKLSATMIDLSMRDNRADPHHDIPSRFPITKECYSAKAKVQCANSSLMATPEEKGDKAAQVDHGLVQVGRELLRISISPITISALALLAFTIMLAGRAHRTDSVKRQSALPATVQQPEKPLASVTTVASKSTPNPAHMVRRNKAKSRRRRDDYIAKDTYVYYGKDDQPNH